MNLFSEELRICSVLILGLALSKHLNALSSICKCSFSILLQIKMSKYAKYPEP